MKKILSTVALFAMQFGIAQTTITLQPGAEEGKDGYLSSRLPTANSGDHEDFLATSWTHSGSPSNVRSLLAFDLTEIPDGATIESATLYLYGYNSPFNTGHASLGDGIGNQAYLQRVTESWLEETVTWDTQPTTTETNQIFLEGTLEENLDYEIDVKTLIEDMILFPEEGFGFMFRLVNEETYNSLLFASSDNENEALHPKLVIVYNQDQPSNILLNEHTALSVYPNNTAQMLQFIVDGNVPTADIKIFAASGALIFEQSNLELQNGVNFANWANGIYILHFQSGDAVLTRKFSIY